MMNRRMIVRSALSLLPAVPLLARAEKREGGPDGDKKRPDGERGVIEGVIVEKDGPKITVEGGKQRLKLIPHWRGGLPKDGGGFDKDMVRTLAGFRKGDRVRVEWVFTEHYRVEAISRLEGRENGKGEPPR